MIWVWVLIALAVSVGGYVGFKTVQDMKARKWALMSLGNAITVAVPAALIMVAQVLFAYMRN
jgi:hypothetical protein